MSASSNKKAFSVRKGNIVRALVRFLIGAVIIAAIVIMIHEFWLKKPNEPATDVTTAADNVPEITQNLSDVADPASTDTQTAVNTPAASLDEDEAQTGEGDEIGSDEADDTVFGDVDETENEPTPTPTVEPTPTPQPAPTPMPASMYSSVVTSKTILSYKWYLDRASRVNHGITSIEILPSENGGNVIALTGWSFGTYYSGSTGWSGDDNTTYIDVTNEKGQTKLYNTTTEPGITGITHTTTGGKNMDKADFTCIIDVSDYPDGTYKLGSRNVFHIKGSRYSHGYGFGDAYNFTVVDGFVTAIGGIENN